MIDKLSREERMRLMRFVCSFAWADLEVQDEEKSFVARLARTFHLSPEELKQVKAWLKVPPRPEEVDPTDVPKHHRQLLLDTIQALVAADRRLSPDEEENLELLTQLLV